MLPNMTTAVAKGDFLNSTHHHSTWDSDTHILKLGQSEGMPPLTGDKSAKLRLDEKSGIGGGIGGWFSGTTTAPETVSLSGEEGLSTTEEALDNSSRSQSSSKGRRTASSNMSSSSSSSSSDKTIRPANTPSPSRFAFFSRSTPAPKVAQVPSNLDDEFINLDITTALFPNGPSDPFSPSSFKNLLMNAEALLTKLQTAYKLRTLAIHELTQEKEAQADELEEAETRAAHLKTQLVDMGKKLVQQDHDILAISNELAAEKQLRTEEKEASEQRFLKAQAQSFESSNKRSSDRSLTSRGSRSSFESYNLEDGDSVFSHSRSHTSTSSAGTGITTPEIIAFDSDNKSIVSRASRTTTIMPPKANTKMLPPPPPIQQKSVFSKLLGGGSNTSALSSQDENSLGLSEIGCANCRGGSSSVAWDAVGLLRAENKGLKERVSLLEDGVDDALGLINRSWR